MSPSALNYCLFGSPKRLLVRALIAVAVTAMLARGDSTDDSLYGRFKVALPKADVAILFDASASMRAHHYDEARNAIVSFTSRLTDNDNVHLRVFGDTVSNPLEGTGQEIADKVESYLPKEPAFTSTDLGLAISKGLEFFERDGASEIQTLLLITDGLHEPPAGSPYSRNFLNDPNWQVLARRAENLCHGRKVLAYGFGLARHTDIALLQRVFPTPNVEMIVGDASQIEQMLTRLRGRLEHARVCEAIDRELSSGLVRLQLEQESFDTTGTKSDLDISIQNSFGLLPITIEKVVVQKSGSGDQQITCTVDGISDGTALNPGQRVQGRIKINLLQDSESFHLGRNERIFESAFSFTPIFHFKDEAALRQLDIDLSHSHTDSRTFVVRMHVWRGTPYWLVAAGVMVIVVGTVLTSIHVKHRRNRTRETELRMLERARLRGTLRIWSADENESRARLIDLADFKLQDLSLTISSDARPEINTRNGYSGDIAARFYTDIRSRRSDHSALASPRQETAYRISSAGSHRLAYESRGEMRLASTITLCDNDLIELDGRWLLRYVNPGLRTRVERESAEIGGEDGFS